MVVTEREAPVLVVGAGPAGLVAALQLARNGQPCLLAERNPTTTKWPKMDITNARSMEILKRLGVDHGLREVGVPQNFSFDVKVSNGLSQGGQLITQWDLPSPDEWRAKIHAQNDGSMPREPYQRCSQVLFEAWLRPKIEAEPLITCIFGWNFESLIEKDSGVQSTFVDTTGATHIVTSQYVIGCDGAGSKVRKAIGCTLEGGPVPVAIHLIHFKSRDLTRLQTQGQFWHIFFTTGACIISQDEVDTWTLHRPVPLDTDISKIDPHEAVYAGLGGEVEPYEIKIDEVLVTSIWRPNIYLADKYTSEHKRVFLSGDSCHQNIPTGGYGMNTAVGDSFDIGWKIAAVLAGHGGKHLLDSYELERRPVAARNIERSGVHWQVHALYVGWCAEQPRLSCADSDDGQRLRKKIADHFTSHNGENTDHGIELDYRYTTSPVIVNEEEANEPDWSPAVYVPSTWPGARAPHVFLMDGETSIHDLFGSGNEYTLLDFTASSSFAESFEKASHDANVPLKVVRLPGEGYAHKIWEADAILVRPDDHVAWRAANDSQVEGTDAAAVLNVATGKTLSPKSALVKTHVPPETTRAFTGTVGKQSHAEVRGLGAFQQ